MSGLTELYPDPEPTEPLPPIPGKAQPRALASLISRFQDTTDLSASIGSAPPTPLAASKGRRASGKGLVVKDFLVFGGPGALEATLGATGTFTAASLTAGSGPSLQFSMPTWAGTRGVSVSDYYAAAAWNSEKQIAVVNLHKAIASAVQASKEATDDSPFGKDGMTLLDAPGSARFMDFCLSQDDDSSADPKQLIATAGTHGVVQLWKIPEGTTAGEFRADESVIGSVAGKVGTVSFKTNDSQFLALSSFDGRVRVLDTSKMELISTFQEHKEEIYATEWSLDQAAPLIASTSKDRKLSIVDLRTKKGVLSFCPHEGGSRPMKMKWLDKRYFCSVGYSSSAGSENDRETKIWDLRKVKDPIGFVPLGLKDANFTIMDYEPKSQVLCISSRKSRIVKTMEFNASKKAMVMFPDSNLQDAHNSFAFLKRPLPPLDENSRCLVRIRLDRSLDLSQVLMRTLYTQPTQVAIDSHSSDEEDEQGESKISKIDETSSLGMVVETDGDDFPMATAPRTRSFGADRPPKILPPSPTVESSPSGTVSPAATISPSVRSAVESSTSKGTVPPSALTSAVAASTSQKLVTQVIDLLKSESERANVPPALLNSLLETLSSVLGKELLQGQVAKLQVALRDEMMKRIHVERSLESLQSMVKEAEAAPGKREVSATPSWTKKVIKGVRGGGKKAEAPAEPKRKLFQPAFQTAELSEEQGRRLPPKFNNFRQLHQLVYLRIGWNDI